MKQYFGRISLALDALIGAFFHYGMFGQTISSRAGIAARKGHKWGCILCKLLNYIDKDHCEGAISNDISRAKAVIADLEQN